MKITAQQLRQIIREEVSKSNLNEAEKIKLPVNFFLGNLGRNKYGICFMPNGKDSMTGHEIKMAGKKCEELVKKYTKEFEIDVTYDDYSVKIYKGLLVVCCHFISKATDPNKIIQNVDKVHNMW